MRTEADRPGKAAVPRHNPGLFDETRELLVAGTVGAAEAAVPRQAAGT